MSGTKRKFFAGAVFVLAVCLLLEGVCFQWSALRTKDYKPVPLAVHADPGSTECSVRDIEIYDVKNIRVTFSGTADVTTVDLFFADDSHRFVEMPGNRALVSPAYPSLSSAIMRLEGHGALRGFTIYWDHGSAVLQAVDLNVPVPYHFRVKRFLLIILTGLFILYVRVFGLWNIVCDFRNNKHRICFAATALVCMLPSLYLYTQLSAAENTEYPQAQTIPYPFEEPVEAYEEMPHALLFDSLYNGVFHVRTEVDERLENADNVFDFTQRVEMSELKYSYWWDYAYFEGKLYVYFGITPVLVFYVPFYFLTGMLPSYVQCSLFLALLSIAGAFLCVWELAKRYTEQTRLYALCMTAAAAAAGSQVLLLQSCPARYQICVASAQAFFFLSVWMALKAAGANGMRRRIWLVPCAVCTALIVTSRPTGVLMAGAWLAVLFCGILFDREQSVRNKAFDAASYLVPLVLCGCAIMAYNCARFGNPFEFGALYQLTSWDMRYVKVSLTSLPKALLYYGFEPLTLNAEFPWFRPGSTYVNQTGNYYYANPYGNAGAFVVPVTWGNLLFFSRTQTKNRTEWRVLFALSLLTATLVSLVNYCIGGVSERYVCDVLPALCLTGAVCILRVLNGDVLESKGAPVVKRLFACVCVLTLVMAISRGYANELNVVRQNAPGRYMSLVKLFSIP